MEKTPGSGEENKKRDVRGPVLLSMPLVVCVEEGNALDVLIAVWTGKIDFIGVFVGEKCEKNMMGGRLLSLSAGKKCMRTMPAERRRVKVVRQCGQRR